MKLLIYALLSISVAMLTVSYKAIASEPHHHHHNHVATNVTNYYTSNGTALSLAMDGIQFSSVDSPQGGLGAGLYEDEQGRTSTGLAFGFGQRLCVEEGNCGLLTVKAGKEEGGGKGLNAGFTIEF